MLVVAVGNRFRRDDGVAFEVASRLRSDLGPGAAVVVETDDVLSVLERWASQDRVVIVDAVRSGANAGTVHRLDASATPCPADWTFASSHQVGLAHAIGLARVLGFLPSSLHVVGIEGGDFGFGDGLSPPVSAAVPRAVSLVHELIVSLQPA